MYTEFLDIILSIVIRVTSMWWLCVPVLVMGIFALCIRVSRGHY